MISVRVRVRNRVWVRVRVKVGVRARVTVRARVRVRVRVRVRIRVTPQTWWRWAQWLMMISMPVESQTTLLNIERILEVILR